MNKLLVISLFFFLGIEMCAQPNCEILKGDEDCYLSCNTAMKAIRYKQGSYKSQELFKKSIEFCPGFAYSYMEKAVPYLKRGQFIEWKRLIDKAVEISPKEYLGYRGWCRLQFLRDYLGTIADIEELKKISKYDIGHCQTGDYHLEVVLALCYKEIGKLEKAKEIFEARRNSKNYTPDLYDDYHFGVIEFELGNYDNAIFAFNSQIEYNEIAESYFYLALANKNLNHVEQYHLNLSRSEELYLQGHSMYDNYSEALDKIYLKDILDEKKKIVNMR